ncbi:MAG: hypothetical protein ACI3V0_01500 [Faecousia sp.]
MMPSFFRDLVARDIVTKDRILSTADGFQAVLVSLAEILCGRGIDTLPGEQAQPLECRYFFDDWYLYAVPAESGHVYSLFKLREQEYDLELGLYADGDTPGVTVSFLSFRTAALLHCLEDPSPANRQALSAEINRVVAKPGQTHDPALKAYFVRPEAEGPYLIAELYVRCIASFAKDGILPVPKYYETILEKQGRIPRFLEENNLSAGYTVCDHRQLFIRHLSRFEKLAILATHTGNTSFHAFAAEVRFHALFLVPPAKIGIPFTGRSLYASAIRADLSIKGSDHAWLYPYYNPNSHLVRQQEACHAGCEHGYSIELFHAVL